MAASALPCVDDLNLPNHVGEFGNRSIISILESRSNQGEARESLFFLADGEALPLNGWSWDDLCQKARYVAIQMRVSAGVLPGDRVLLAYAPGLDFVAAFYGCLYLKAIPVPVPPPRRREKFNRLKHISHDAQIAGILCSPEHQQQMQELAEQLGNVFCLSPQGTAPKDAARKFVVPDIQSDDLAVLQYTSGSTSAPKGVMLTHGNVMANLEQIATVFGATPQDRMLSWLPHYHDMGLIGTVLFPLYAGFPIAFMSPAAFLRSPMRFLEIASTWRATGFGAPNFGFDHCVRHATPAALERLDLSHLRIAFSGSEMIRFDTIEEFTAKFAPAGFRHEALLTCYGMAETVLLISGGSSSDAPRYMTVDRDALGRGDVCQCESGLKLASCGRPAPGINLAIVDPKSGVEQEANRTGEIWVSGANVATGYWRNLQATQECFDQTMRNTGGWFRTGDLGFVSEGEVFVTGRLKDAIVIRGQNHAPQDIEATIVSSHDALLGARSAAFAIETGGRESLFLVAELHREAFRQIDSLSDAIIGAIRSAVTDTHGLQPARIVLVRPGGLPVTPSGKVQRFACRDGLAEGSLPVLASWDRDARNETETVGWRCLLNSTSPLRREAVLVAEMQSVLTALAGVPDEKDITPNSRLFDLGLDSVAGIEFVSKLETELNLTLDPIVIYEFPTLGALAPWLLDQVYPPAAETGIPPTKLSEASSEVANEMAALAALLKA